MAVASADGRADGRLDAASAPACPPARHGSASSSSTRWWPPSRLRSKLWPACAPSRRCWPPSSSCSSGQAAISQARSLTEHVLHSRLNLSINTRIIRKALELDLTHFENAEFYDKLQNARREADWRGLQIVNGGFYLVQNVLTLLSFAALLVRFSPLLALILFVATLPAFVAQSSYADLTFRVISWRAPEARKLAYLEHLLTDYDSVKEVKLFGLGEPLLGRYADLFWKFLREDQAIAQRRSLASFGWGLLATLTYYGSYAWIVLRAVGRTITLGDMTLYLGIFRNSQQMFESIFFGLSELYENGLFMSNLFAFLELKPQLSAIRQPASARSRRSARASSSEASPSATRVTTSSPCTTSTWSSTRARRSPWSGRTAPARRPSSSCSPACTTRPRGASCSTASTCATTIPTCCAAASE